MVSLEESFAYNTTFYNLYNVVEKLGVELVNSTITRSEYNDFEYLSYVFCNSRGNYNRAKATCDCDIGFFNERCEISGLVYWKNGWGAFQGIISSIFALLAIITWISLWKNLSAEYGSFWKKIRRIMVCPKYLIIMNIIIMATSKLIYIL
jgi:hypothetical protein